MKSNGTAMLERLVPAEVLASDEPAWMQEARSSAYSWLRSRGLPTGRDEAWKYTPLSEILAAAFDPATAAPVHHLTTAMVDDLAGRNGGVRLVFVNGFYAPELSDVAAIPAGVRCGDQTVLFSAPDAGVGAALVQGYSVERFDGFQALNHAVGHGAAVVLVAPATNVAEPIHIVHLAIPGPTPVASHPRTLVQLAADSRVTLIETYSGLAGQGLTNASTTIDVGPRANLEHYRVQTEAAESIHLGHTTIRQDDGSRVRSLSVMLGGDVARSEIDVILHGYSTDVDLKGIYLPTGTQQHDNVTTVEHAGSAGTSNQLFKGVIDGHGHGSFSGRIIVQPDTKATNSEQTSRSLVLQPTAQADTRPWLEIFADDVRCDHGATVGRLDPEALFYLRTRGIERAEARTMLMQAFIDEITEFIGPDALRAHVHDAIVEHVGRPQV